MSGRLVWLVAAGLIVTAMGSVNAEQNAPERDSAAAIVAGRAGRVFLPALRRTLTFETTTDAEAAAISTLLPAGSKDVRGDVPSRLVIGRARDFVAVVALKTAERTPRLDAVISLHRRSGDNIIDPRPVIQASAILERRGDVVLWRYSDTTGQSSSGTKSIATAPDTCDDIADAIEGAETLGCLLGTAGLGVLLCFFIPTPLASIFSGLVCWDGPLNHAVAKIYDNGCGYSQCFVKVRMSSLDNGGGPYPQDSVADFYWIHGPDDYSIDTNNVMSPEDSPIVYGKVWEYEAWSESSPVVAKCSPTVKVIVYMVYRDRAGKYWTIRDTASSNGPTIYCPV